MMAWPVAYAFTLGLIAAVNPCGFPLLPAYLALFVGGEATATKGTRTIRGLTAGACVTAGFLAVFGAAGILIESGMFLLFGWVPWVMIVVGCGMVAVGVQALAGGYLRVRLPVFHFGTGRSAAAMAGFGVAYAIGSLSCALPLFLAGVGGAFTRLGFLGGVATFGAYALGMGMFVIGASLVAVHAGPGALQRIRPLARVMPRVAGAVVIVVGLYLAGYWASVLLDPLAIPAPTRLVDAAQSAISAGLSASPLISGAVLGGVVIAGFGFAAVTAHQKAADRKDHVRHD